MPLQILSEPVSKPDEVVEQIRDAINAKIAEAKVEVTTGGPGHFQITVVSDTFAGESRVRQQQMVYAAIAHLMGGDNPPVHAIDQMVTRES